MAVIELTVEVDTQTGETRLKEFAKSVTRGFDEIRDKSESALSRVRSQLDSLSSKLKDTGRDLQSIGSSLSLAVTAPIVGLAALGIKELIEVQSVVAQTNAAIRATGGASNITAKQVRDLANELQKTSAIDSELIQSGANLLLSMKGIRNEAGEGNDVFNRAVRIITDLSVAMGTDTRSAALQLGKALQDPIQGMMALRRANIYFTASQESMIKQLVNSGHLMEAQKLILDDLTQFQGRAAAEAATLGGSLKALRERVEEVSASYTEKALPAINSVRDALMSTLEWFDSLSDSTKTFIVVSLGLAAVIGPVAIALGAIVVGLAGLTTLFGAALAPIGLVVTAIAGLTAAAFAFEPVGHAVLSILHLFASVGASVAKMFYTLLAPIGLITDALGLTSGAFDELKSRARQAAEDTITHWKRSQEELRRIFSSIETDWKKTIPPLSIPPQLKLSEKETPKPPSGPMADTLIQIEAYSKKLQDLGYDLRDFSIDMEKVRGSAEDQIGVLNKLREIWGGYQQGLGRAQAAQTLLSHSIGNTGKSLNEMIAGLSGAGITLSDLQVDLNDLYISAESQAEVVGKIVSAYGSWQEQLGANIVKQDEFKRESADLMAQLEMVDRIGRALGSSFDVTQAKTTLLTEAIAKFVTEGKGTAEEIQALRDQLIGMSNDQMILEATVNGAASAIKSAWSDTAITMEQVFKNSLNIFVDTLAQMVIANKGAMTAIQIQTAAATAGISLAFGALGALFAGGGKKIQIEPLTDRLEKVFNDFIRNFKGTLGDFQEKLFPPGKETQSLLGDIRFLINSLKLFTTDRFTKESRTFLNPEALQRLRNLGVTFSGTMDDFLVSIAKAVSENLTEVTSLLEAQFSKIEDTIKGIGDEINRLEKSRQDFRKGARADTVEIERAFFSQSELYQVLQSDVASLNDEISRLTGQDKLDRIGDLQEAIVSTFEQGIAVLESRLSDLDTQIRTVESSTADLTSEMGRLADAQRQFLSITDESIISVERAFFSEQELFNALQSDIENLKQQASGAVGESRISLLDELRDKLIEAFDIGSGLLQKTIPEMESRLAEEQTKLITLQAALAEDLRGQDLEIISKRQALIDEQSSLVSSISNEITGKRDELTALQTGTLSELQALRDEGKTEFQRLLDFQQSQLDIAASQLEVLRAQYDLIDSGRFGLQADAVSRLSAIQTLADTEFSSLIAIQQNQLALIADQFGITEGILSATDLTTKIETRMLQVLEGIESLGRGGEGLTTAEQLQVAQAIADFSTQLFGDIPGLQHGGIVSQPGIYKVAEREPELVAPLSGGGFPVAVTVPLTVNIDGEKVAKKMIRVERLGTVKNFRVTH